MSKVSTNVWRTQWELNADFDTRGNLYLINVDEYQHFETASIRNILFWDIWKQERSLWRRACRRPNSVIPGKGDQDGPPFVGYILYVVDCKLSKCRLAWLANYQSRIITNRYPLPGSASRLQSWFYSRYVWPIWRLCVIVGNIIQHRNKLPKQLYHGCLASHKLYMVILPVEMTKAEQNKERGGGSRFFWLTFLSSSDPNHICFTVLLYPNLDSTSPTTIILCGISTTMFTVEMFRAATWGSCQFSYAN